MRDGNSIALQLFVMCKFACEDLKMEIVDISKEIKKIIDAAEIRAIKEQGENWKEKYEWLVEILKGIRSEAEMLIDDYKQNGLSISVIEAEGFLRCAITVCNEVDRVESAYTKNT